MKKLLLFVFFLQASFLQAQILSGMQDNNLALGSHWVASDTLYGNGGFDSQGMFFPCNWDTSFGGYWSSGFALSSMTDSVTPGFANMYSSRPGSGYQSSKYAVCYGSAVLRTANRNAFSPGSLRITNTTYAAMSMREGDSFAKKFGGASGNDPDYFRLIIKAMRNGQVVPDSVVFYLADYRFSNNSQDYIVNSWRLLDLTSLGALADSLLFSMESSDNATFGMNTPAYFAVDDFIWQQDETQIKEIAPLAVDIFPNPCADELMLQCASDVSVIIVTDAAGKHCITRQGITSGRNLLSVASLDRGLYFVRVTGKDGSKGISRFMKY